MAPSHVSNDFVKYLTLATAETVLTLKQPSQFFFKKQFCFLYLWYFCMRLAQYNKYLVSTVGTDGLAL